MRKVSPLPFLYATMVIGGLLAGCSSTQTEAALSTPAGQLFCGVATSTGASVVVALVDAVTGLPVIATNALAATVAADCAKAGGVPVVPPAAPVPTVAVAMNTAADATVADGSDWGDLVQSP